MSEREAPDMYVKIGRGVPEIDVQGKSLSREEREACAVLVACMRRGWFFDANPDGSVTIGTAAGDFDGRTPSEAYTRALAAMEEEV